MVKKRFSNESLLALVLVALLFFLAQFSLPHPNITGFAVSISPEQQFYTAPSTDAVSEVKKDLDIAITRVVFDNEAGVVIEYVVNSPLLGSETVLFKATDASGIVVASKNHRINGPVGKEILDIAAARGEIITIAAVSGGQVIVEESVLQRAPQGITGRALSDFGSKYSSLAILILVFCFLAFFIIKRIWSLKNMHVTSRMTHHGPRKIVHRA